jgi:hypothetical protein
MVDQLIWQLIQECAPQNDDDIKYQAGQCLGELGAVDPYAIAFFFPSSENKAKPASVANVDKNNSGSPSSPRDKKNIAESEDSLMPAKVRS